MPENQEENRSFSLLLSSLLRLASFSLGFPGQKYASNTWAVSPAFIRYIGFTANEQMMSGKASISGRVYKLLSTALNGQGNKVTQFWTEHSL